MELMADQATIQLTDQENNVQLLAKVLLMIGLGSLLMGLSPIFRRYK